MAGLLPLWCGRSVLSMARRRNGRSACGLALIYARAICKMSKNVRECENFNNNLRIKAHVLASVEGKAWARGRS